MFLKLLDERKDDLADDMFLDVVFGSNPFLPREEWEKNVLTGVKWIFDSSNLRAAVYAFVKKEAGGENKV